MIEGVFRRQFFASCLSALGSESAAQTSRLPFISGLYSLPRAPGAWREAVNSGFSVVRVPPSIDRVREAAAHGVKVWVAVGSGDRVRPAIEALKHEAAILFWETEDEPAFQWKKRGPRVTPERMIAAYREIKSLDETRPVYLNHAPVNLVSTLQAYNPGADIIATDIYPVIPHGIREQYALWPDGQQGDLLDSTISQVGRYADKMREVAGPSAAVFMVLQAFAWENTRPPKDRDPKMVLYPTRDQMRFMAWQSIAHGVDGLLWWGLDINPPDAPVWPDLQAVAREIAGYAAALAMPKRQLNIGLKYFDTGHSLDRGIEWIAKGNLLAAVNADRNPVDVEITGFRSNPIRELFEPFGVRLYQAH